MLTLDSTNGDLSFDENGNLVTVEDDDELSQSLRLLLETNKGEWFLNTNTGFDYDLITEKNPDLNLISAGIVDTLFQDSRVTDAVVTDISLDSAGRTLTVNLEITTEDSTTTLEEILNV